MREAAVIIEPSAEFAHRLCARLADRLSVQQAGTVQQARELIAADSGAPAVALIGPNVGAPVDAAQQLHQVADDLEIVICAYPDEHEAVDRALRFAPLGRGQVVSRPAGDLDALAAEASAAATRRAQRRRHSAAVQAANQALGAGSPRAPAFVTHLGALLEDAPIGVVTLDHEARISGWNAFSAEIFGAGAELRGRSLPDLFAAGQRDTLERLIAGSAGGAGASGAVVARKHDDGTDFFEVSVSDLTRAGGGGRLVLLQRVTERIVAQRQLEQLQQLSDVALSHLALDDLLEALLTRITKTLAVDTAAILLTQDDGTLAVAAARGLEGEVEAHVSVPFGAGFAGRVAEARAPLVIDQVDPDTLISPVLREAGICSLVGVPLMVDAEVIGVLHVGSLVQRSFDQSEVALLRLAADRAALAIDHARLFEQQHNLAAELQRSLLPDALPDLPTLEVAARYVAGGADVEVGGDWYDVIALPDGGLAVAIGDIVGRGLEAAKQMGQLRVALRAYAVEGHGPREVVRNLDRLVESLEVGDMSTLAYLVLDPRTWTLELVNAGHPPPLVRAPDGTPRFLAEGRRVPLGLGGAHEGEAATVQLEPGSTLVLYTDGLIERRDASLDEGLRRLSDVVAGAPPGADEICDALLERIGESDDDIAVVVIAPVPTHSPRVLLRLPAEPDSAPAMRRRLGPWLDTAGASADARQAILLAATEALANAIEHAYGPGEHLVEVDATFAEGEAVVAVRDFGRWRAPRGRHRGRGLMLMEQLMDSVEARSGEGGTTVVVRRSLASSPA